MTSCLVDTETDLRDALAEGGEIRLDSATVIDLSEPLEITRPTTLIGGAFHVESGPALRILSSDVEIHRTRITGGGNSCYEREQKLIHAEGTASDPLYDITIRDCRLADSRGSNIWLEWCRRVLISGNLINRFLYSGIMIVSGEDVTIASNIVTDSPMVDPVVNVYGIAVTDLDNTDAARSRDCTIVGNRVDLIDWEAIDTHGGERITITGNTVTASPRGIALVAGNETRVTVPRQCVVSGNLVDGSGARRPLREGIGVFGIPYAPADATVTGNTVTGYGNPFHASYVDRGKTFIGGNSEPLVGWTPITLDGDYGPNTTYPPEFRVDGNTVWVRGGVIPKGAAQRKIIGHVSSAHAWPDVLTFLGYVQGSNAGAGNGMIGVWPDGKLQLFYYSGTDRYTYFLTGAYQAR